MMEWTVVPRKRQWSGMGAAMAMAMAAAMDVVFASAKMAMCGGSWSLHYLAHPRPTSPHLLFFFFYPNGKESWTELSSSVASCRLCAPPAGPSQRVRHAFLPIRVRQCVLHAATDPRQRHGRHPGVDPAPQESTSNREEARLLLATCPPNKAPELSTQTRTKSGQQAPG